MAYLEPWPPAKCGRFCPALRLYPASNIPPSFNEAAEGKKLDKQVELFQSMLTRAHPEIYQEKVIGRGVPNHFLSTSDFASGCPIYLAESAACAS